MAKDAVAVDSQILNAQRTPKKAKHNEFLKLVMEHAAKFRNYHADRKKEINKISKAVLNHHINQRKLVQIQKERAEKERLRLLKVCIIL